ncbi:hypothetical protein BWQ96_04375 [Gracilariopsis chorda]|uniref:Cupin type-2 domain-containing protein n=1 Tax=Gracilariopsis chorda TaxID=448386 RepID=A0A2V3IUM6_9FLOR|nr:hypothetical protein BWQ96_04375 [Gracilariopsis chorda]|eukprot:PXF45838.1 hypothetical protein BWQ96_04375 [Gracilariopsis chorda]
MESAPGSFGNLYENVPHKLTEELFQVLVKTDNFIIERIVSTGQVSTEWYDQDEVEFCCVLKGAAELLFDASEKPMRMNPGAFVVIPAHVRHKVVYTDNAQPTVWLAMKWKK